MKTRYKILIAIVLLCIMAFVMHSYANEPYDCVDKKCIRKSDGKYKTLDICNTACGIVPDTPDIDKYPPGEAYSCTTNKGCVPVVDDTIGAMSKDNCEANCPPPPTPPVMVKPSKTAVSSVPLPMTTW